jgi:hypothetical protein
MGAGAGITFNASRTTLIAASRAFFPLIHASLPMLEIETSATNVDRAPLQALRRLAGLAFSLYLTRGWVEEGLPV